MRTMLALTFSGMFLALAGACSSDELPPASDPPAAGASGQDCPDGGVSAGPVSCDKWIQRLVDCQVIGGTRVSGCADNDPILPCAWDCMQKATCAQIKTSYCNNTFNGYAGCINECNMMPIPFICDDGSKIDVLRTCDGIPDCPNGEDEDCTTGMFYCDNGTPIPAKWQCDGVKDCLKGEDEDGCAPGPMFICDTGESLDESLECNGIDDCPGGEDEFDCARLTCD